MVGLAGAAGFPASPVCALQAGITARSEATKHVRIVRLKREVMDEKLFSIGLWRRAAGNGLEREASRRDASLGG
jgi:hypothetical protein